MNLLIDTHIFLWLLFSPEKISKSKLIQLEQPENNVSISSVSFWEISLKFSLGKLSLKGTRPEDLPALATQMNIDCLALTPELAASFHQLPKIKHKDPFDRMIIWQAIQEKQTLVSNDKNFTEYKAKGLKLL